MNKKHLELCIHNNTGARANGGHGKVGECVCVRVKISVHVCGEKEEESQSCGRIFSVEVKAED